MSYYVNIEDRLQQFKINNLTPEQEDELYTQPVVVTPEQKQEKITDVTFNPEAGIGAPLTLEDVKKHQDPMEAVAVGKGVVQGTLGLPGDIVGLVSGLANMIPTTDGKGWIQPEGKSWNEASAMERFQAGYDKAPLTSQDIKAFSDELLNKFGIDLSKFSTAETVGEFAAPGKAVDTATKATVKALNKIKGK